MRKYNVATLDKAPTLLDFYYLSEEQKNSVTFVVRSLALFGYVTYKYVEGKI